MTTTHDAGSSGAPTDAPAPDDGLQHPGPDARIRAARPADVERLLPLHRDAFAGTMGVKLGTPYLRHFLRRFIEAPDAVCLVGTDADGALTGYVFGAPLDAARRTTRATAPWAALGLVTHPRLLARRSVTDEVARRLGVKKAPGGGPETPLPPPTCSLVGIGVAPSARGTGLGQALVEAFEHESRRFAPRSVRLSVYKDNTAARRLYERSGWQPYDHPTNDAVVYYGRETEPSERSERSEPSGQAAADGTGSSPAPTASRWGRLRAQLRFQLRYDLPIVAGRVLLDPLPDNQLTMRLRGRLARPFLASAGPNLQLGRDVTLIGTDRLHLGRDVYLAKGCWLNAGGGLTIEDEVMFGPYVVVSTSDHVFRDGSARFTGVSTAPIRIGRGSWVSTHVTVTKGVTIGEGVLVAAGSVVTTDVPPHSVMGGVPGRVLGPVPEHEPNAFSRSDLT